MSKTAKWIRSLDCISQREVAAIRNSIKEGRTCVGWKPGTLSQAIAHTGFVARFTENEHRLFDRIRQRGEFNNIMGGFGRLQIAWFNGFLTLEYGKKWK